MGEKMYNAQKKKSLKSYLLSFLIVVMLILSATMIKNEKQGNAEEIEGIVISAWSDLTALANDPEVLTIERGVLLDHDNDPSTPEETYNIYTFKKNISTTNTIVLPYETNVKICGVLDGNGNKSVTIKKYGDKYSSMFKRQYGTGNLIINDLILDGNGIGGGIWHGVDGIVNLKNVTLKNCVSNDNGAALHARSHTYISDCEFENNIIGSKKYGDVGGAVFVYEDSVLKINNSSFKGNEAKQGGAIYIAEEVEFHINNSSFENNVGEINGGAIFSDGNSKEGSITDCVFENNNSQKGGAVFAYGDRVLKINNSSFKGNKAKYGGAIGIAEEVEFHVNNSTFENNVGEIRGGAIISDGNSKEGSITNCTFENNSSQNAGAVGIYANTAALTIEDSDFKNNNAYFGGAIVSSTEYDSFKINGCDFEGNNATLGGAVMSLYSPNTYINDCNFIENEAYHLKDTEYWRDNVLLNDELGGLGSAIYSEYSETSITDTTITGNVAEDFGAIASSSVVFLKNTVIKENKARAGGAIALDEGHSYLILSGTNDIPYNEDGIYEDKTGKEKQGYYNDILCLAVQKTASIFEPIYEHPRGPYLIMYNALDGVSYDDSQATGKFGITLLPVYADASVALYNSEETLSELPFVLLKYNEETETIELNEEDEIRQKSFSGIGMNAIYVAKNISSVLNKNDIEIADMAYSKEGNVPVLSDTQYTVEDNSYYYGHYGYKIDDGNKGEITVPVKAGDEFKVKEYINRAGISKAIIEGIDQANMVDPLAFSTEFVNNYFGEIEAEVKIICDLSSLQLDEVEAIKSEDSKWGYKVSAGGRILDDDECEIEVTSQNETSVTINVKAADNAEFYTGQVTGLVVEAPPIIKYKEVAADGEVEVVLNNLKNKVDVDIAEIRQTNANVSEIKAVVKSGITLSQTIEEKIKETNSKIEEKEKLDAYEIYVARYDDEVDKGKQNIFDDILVTIKMPKEEGYNYKNFEIYHGIDKNGDGIEDDVGKINLESIVENKNDMQINFYTDSFSTFAVYADKKVIETGSGGSSGGGSSSSSRPSTSNTNTQTVIIKTNHKSIMNGFIDNTFKTSNNATRGEVAAILSRLDENYKENTSYEAYLEGVVDIPQNDWARNYLGYMRKTNVITGTQSLMQPTSEITRAELAKIICYYKKLDSEGKISKFADANGRWYDKYVATLSELGWIEGYTDGTFGGTDKVTRAELCKILCLMTDREIKDTNKITQSIKTSLAKKFTDINDTSWYYPYVVELTYDHISSELH